MAKNLVLCCDGTHCSFTTAHTNVVKLCRCLIQDPARQMVYYHPGLGTLAPPGAFTPLSRRISLLLGQAFGVGFARDLHNAYLFLVKHFEPGDSVFLFGFSRGAYTVRALASMLHMYGLIRRGNEALIPYVIDRICAIRRSRKQARRPEARASVWQEATTFKQIFSVPCAPAFVGVWDTVNAIGAIGQNFHVPYTANNPDIAVARQALAIDERRGFFLPALWAPKPAAQPDSGPRDLKQVWFAGCHGDVGGGYPNAESGLSQCAFRWMLGEASQHGLLISPRLYHIVIGHTLKDRAGPDPNGPRHNSMKWPWQLAECIPRRLYDPARRALRWRINLFRRRRIPAGALVHMSVFQRLGYINSCPNFPKQPVQVHDQPVVGVDCD